MGHQCVAGRFESRGYLNRIRHSKSRLTPDAGGSMCYSGCQIGDKPSWRRGQGLSIGMRKLLIALPQRSGEYLDQGHCGDNQFVAARIGTGEERFKSWGQFLVIL